MVRAATLFVCALLCALVAAASSPELHFRNATAYLPPLLLDRAVVHPGTLEGPWRAFLAKLERREPVVVAAIGASSAPLPRRAPLVSVSNNPSQVSLSTPPPRPHPDPQ